MEIKEINVKDLKETLLSKIINLRDSQEIKNQIFRDVKSNRKIRLIKFSEINNICFYIDTFEMVIIINPIIQIMAAARKEGERE
jgi:hypothetical protein